MFSQARAFNFPLVVAAQSTDQLRPAAVQAEIFQNARSKIAFQTDADARTIASLMGPPVTPDQVKGLGAWEVVARLAAGNRVTRPVTATTYPPPHRHGARAGDWASVVRRAALTACGVSKEAVEAEIARRQAVTTVAPPPDEQLSTSEVGYEPWPE